METMQAQIDNLMSMIKAQPVAKSGVELSVKLVALKDDNDIESYLVTFGGKGTMAALSGSTVGGKSTIGISRFGDNGGGRIQAIKEAILTR